MTGGTTGRGARGPYARTAQRRRVIAGAVLDIVLEKGHGGVTTAEVARRSGSREATVMYHYPTRDHLLVAALEHAEEEDFERHLAGNDAEVLDLEGLRAYARAVPRRESIMRLYTALAGDATVPGHPAQEYFAGHYRAVTDKFADLIARRQAAGLAHPGLDPVEVARQVIAVWDGLQAQWLVDPAFDLGDHLVAAFRRLTAQNWMEARRTLLDPGTGL
ncbi:TetR/AcrR family transcriptional regulator [Yinghuangia sp. ASG 101]|uniref:TetR/AcrR family transcriptional regulator n=1 Tax=Yinghuangia sp. ASG 101 TaxID=2896848 RepID=UPI001E379BDD|nr:TetR/AcrR family transcriptional regulator [Yinghuangia sp. ASG 101]UGQ12758.1 TetR/AcrR family transcriptional regulator [Yinghuangia sp. ASG 101]